MEYRVLGPLEVRDGDRSVPLAGAKQRALLALLLVNANHVVSRDRLIDELWGERAPETALQSLQVYVSRLRKVLPAKTLLTRPPGYLLEVAPDDLDLTRFERLLAEGIKAEGDPERASALLQDALALWRGPALAEFAFDAFARAEIGRLEDLRLAAVQERIAADLALGRHAEVIGELEALIAENPHRERLRGQLIVALYRSGRQAEALEAYQAARHALVDELGIEPGADLQRLEKQILTHDPDLDAPSRPSPAAPARPRAAQPSLGRVHARKTVSILFCDVVDSTPLGEQLDPESLQRVMSRWFVEARAIVERHGGTVEKFIGDEVMAVFGVPVVHEDDALRAVRSAAALRDRLETLNDELEALFGVRLAVRIGVNTGEVVVGDPSSGSTFVTGEPVNLAKRLEQAANPGQILIGRATYPLVENAVRAGPLESFRVKGKRDVVSPWMVEYVDEGAVGVARRLDAPLVNRLAELGRLHAAFEAAAGANACRLVTLLGPAGIGKTRLAEELARQLGGRARVLTGRCLPYGDGITFWPLVEVLRALGPEGLETALAGNVDRDAVTERLRTVTGGGGSSTAVDELFWAARRLVEALAAERPLVFVIEDLDRGEPTLLDLVDYLQGRVEAPVLLLCLARADLLERRPGWAAPRERAEIALLEPLSEQDAAMLLAGLGADLDEAARERVLRSAEGNPLYVEQLAALAETGDLVVPPTIQALLSERLDRLDTGERAVLERAAIVGQEFSRRAVTDLSPPELRGDVGRHLLELVRKELVRPHASASSTEDGFRFRHALIRDVTYEAMPKDARALFHEWFADWLERNAGERLTEIEEIVGYHLEQSVRLREQLGGPQDARGKRLAERGGGRLAASGRRAFGRDDLPAAVSLLARALALLGPDAPERPALLALLGSAQAKGGDFRAAEATFGQGAEAARRLGDRRSELRITVERQAMKFFLAPAQTSEENIRVANDVIPELEALDDNLGLAKAWRLLSDAHATSCRWQAKADALEKALRHARRSPEAHNEISGIVGQIAQALHYGPTPAVEAIARCRELLAAAEDDRATRAGVGASLAALLAARESFHEARMLFADAISLYEELGLRFRRTVRALDGAEIETLAGDLPGAERQLRDAYAALEEMGESAVRPVVAAVLANVLCLQGADDEALHFAGVAETLAQADDVYAQVVRRTALARVLARQGRPAEAEGPAQEAIELADETDYLALRADARLALASVRRGAGDDGEAQSLRDAARELYERKGNLAAAGALDLPLGSAERAL